MHQPPWSSSAILSICCPAADFCVGVDAKGFVVTSTQPTLGRASWHVSPVPGADWFTGVSCPTTRFCAAVDHWGDIATSSRPMGGWRAWRVLRHIDPAQYMTAVSCPSVKLRVAVDESGRAWVATHPAGGRRAWHSVIYAPGDKSQSVSCPSASFCVVAGDTITTTTDPTDGAAAWHTAGTDLPSLVSVSCLSRSLCLAGDQYGDILSSRNPIAGRDGWKSVPAGRVTLRNWNLPYNPVDGLSCLSRRLCIAALSNGNVIVSHDPTGGASAWRRYRVDAPQLLALSCPTAGMCITSDSAGGIVPVAPLAPHMRRRRQVVDGINILTGVACPSVSLCVAVDGQVNIMSSSHPFGPAPTWSVATVKSPPLVTLDTTGLVYRWLAAVSCASTHLCVVVDPDGRVMTSTAPASGRRAWHVVRVVSRQWLGLMAVSCTAKPVCVAAGYSAIATSTDPGRAQTWRIAALPNQGQLQGVSCASSSLCVAVGPGTNILASRRPTAGPQAWRRSTIRTSSLAEFDAISCPSTHLCAAVDSNGEVVTSRHPLGGAESWRVVDIDGRRALSGIACPSDRLCVAVDSSGRALFSADPSGGRRAWHAQDIEGPIGLASVSCPSRSQCVAVDELGQAFALRVS